MRQSVVGAFEVRADFHDQSLSKSARKLAADAIVSQILG
jgi:hypothetical protein